jgi:putative transposase
MAQSLHKIYIHLIFHIKNDGTPIREDDQERVHSYIGQLVNATGCAVVRVGGTADHVHILFLLSKDASISYVVEEVKRNSSRWLKSVEYYYRVFAWQGGYAAFSVSRSMVDKTIDYISNQREHHKKWTFAEEYIEFLKLYDVDYNEEYVLKD